MQVIRSMLLMFRRRPWPASGVVALMVVASSVEGVGIGFLVPLLEAINTEGDLIPESQVSRYISTAYGWFDIPFELWTIMLGGFVLFTTQALLKYFQQTQSTKLSAGVTADVRTELHRNVLQADLAFLHSKKGGELGNSLITEPDRYYGAFVGSLNLMALLIASAVYLALALLLSWALVLVAMGMIGAATFVLKFELKRASRYGNRFSQVNAEIHSTTVEHVGGVRILKAFNLESISFKAFTDLAKEKANLYYVTAKSRSRLETMYEAGMVGGLLLIVYYAVTFSNMSVPLLLTFIFILYRFYPRVGGINKNLHSLLLGMPAVQRISRLTEETRNPTIQSGVTSFSRLEEGIRFEGVSFAYDGNIPVLNQIDFSMERGETTAVVGSSGAGKTTLVNLIMRFYDTSSGRILVDGKDLRDLDLTAWRGALGLVNQDIFLFNDTIRNNIALGKLDATEVEIVAAARSAYAEEFIRELPEKYETMIGDRGVRLSGGQRQRIALARAVVRDPQILILDEATSELDSKSERLIQQAIDELGADRTIFTIAHRLSTIRHADKILVLEDGRIAEEGRHEKLVRSNGQYVQLLRIQERVAASGD